MKQKLAQAAALAAVLVPLGTVAVETESMTCGFYGASNRGVRGWRDRRMPRRPSTRLGYRYILTFLDGSAPVLR